MAEVTKTSSTEEIPAQSGTVQTTEGKSGKPGFLHKFGKGNSKVDGKEAKPKKKGRSKKRKKLITWLIIIAVVAAGIITVIAINNAAKKNQASQETIYVVARGDMLNNITANGVMEPLDKRDIVASVQNVKVLDSPFEEGDIIQEGMLLYSLDSSSLENDIKTTKNAMEKANINNRSNYETMNDWSVKAPVSGRIENLKLVSSGAGAGGAGSNIKVGDNISTGTKICEINNSNVLHIKLPFLKTSVEEGIVSVGKSVRISSSRYSNLDGNIIEISQSTKALGSGIIGYEVKISVKNPGGIVANESGFVGEVDGVSSLDVTNTEYGVAELSANEIVTAQASGTVAAIYVKEGDNISSGATIIKITNSSTIDNIDRSAVEYHDLELKLETQLKKLEDYSVTSPISGTVIKKTVKTGDTLGQSANAAIMTSIADLSKMKFVMDIDENDIAKVKIGQKVVVTADALTHQVFDGTITLIQQEGTSTNGVTTYPVEVTIDVPGELKIGMNVDATVQVEHKADVLKVPIEAVIRQGGKTYVRVVTGDAAKAQANPAGGASGGTSGGGAVRVGGGTGGGARSSGGGGGSAGGGATFRMGAPSGASTGGGANAGASGGAGERREVEIGMETRDEAEIISGLSEGESIYIPNVGESSAMQQMMTENRNNSPMGGSSGGGGGAPAGGASGGSGGR